MDLSVSKYVCTWCVLGKYWSTGAAQIMSKEIYICEYGNALMIMMKRLVLHGQIFNTLRVTILNALRKDNIILNLLQEQVEAMDSLFNKALNKSYKSCKGFLSNRCSTMHSIWHIKQSKSAQILWKIQNSASCFCLTSKEILVNCRNCTFEVVVYNAPCCIVLQNTFRLYFWAPILAGIGQVAKCLQ